MSEYGVCPCCHRTLGMKKIARRQFSPDGASALRSQEQEPDVSVSGSDSNCGIPCGWRSTEIGWMVRRLLGSSFYSPSDCMNEYSIGR